MLVIFMSCGGGVAGSHSLITGTNQYPLVLGQTPLVLGHHAERSHMALTITAPSGNWGGAHSDPPRLRLDSYRASAADLFKRTAATWEGLVSVTVFETSIT